MKPYLDGTLEVKASATSTEPSNGDAKSISFSPLLVDIRPVSDAPVATAGQDAGFSAFVVENNDYSRLAGGADSTWFSAAVVSPDPDEKTAFVIDAGGWASGLAIVVADAAHNATARYVLGANGKSWNKIDLATNVLTQSVDLRIDGTNLASTTLRLESAAATTNSNLPLATTLQWHAESVDTYASNAQYDAAPALSSGTIGFAVFKVATAPTIGAGGLIELNDGGSKTVVLPTLSGLGSGELVSYRLSEVPEWLRPSGATLVSTDATTHLSVYSLPLASGTNAASLQFVAIGSNLRSAQTASFKIAAFSTEAGSGDTARSAEVIESVKVNPVVTTPTLLGPKLLQIDEGGTATLAGVKAFITPGDSAEVLSTIDVMFAANVRGADVAAAGGAASCAVTAGGTMTCRAR